MKVTLLLDVDDVLNMFGWGSDKVAKTWGDTYRFKASGFVMQVSPRMLGRIRSWMDEGLVDARWLTTWELGDSVRELEAEFGWKELPIAGRRADAVKVVRKMREDIGWWKLEFAQAAYDEGGPVVWVDDEISSTREAMNWIATTDRERLLAVSPISGLIPGDVDLIEEFIMRHNDEERHDQDEA